MRNFFLSVKFYCFRQGPHISFKYAWHNHLRCLVVGVVSLEHSLIKHTCSWLDKLIVLWNWTDKQKYFHVYSTVCTHGKKSAILKTFASLVQVLWISMFFVLLLLFGAFILAWSLFSSFLSGRHGRTRTCSYNASYANKLYKIMYSSLDVVKDALEQSIKIVRTLSISVHEKCSFSCDTIKFQEGAQDFLFSFHSDFVQL